MVKKTNRKTKKILIIITVIFALALVCYSVYELYFKNDIFRKLQEETATIEHYTRYGTHLNMSGNLELKEGENEPNEATLVLKSDSSEYIIPTYTDSENGVISFNTSKHINDGINLEALPEGDFLLLLKLSTEDGERYYSLDNQTDYEGFEYYTITYKAKNYKTVLSFEDYVKHEGRKNEERLPYVSLSTEKSKLPEDVYDFAIEVGHGGADPGAVGQLNGVSYTEFQLNLKIALEIKQLLTDGGYKVVLTHETDIDLPAYGYHGRATLANDVRAKYNFSVHNNSSATPGYTGTEIYAANDSDYTFAKLLSEKIVRFGSGARSSLDFNVPHFFQPVEGVFVRLFNEENIESTNADLAEYGVEAYPNLYALKTNYYYMIREIGGISTGAYVDGRNPEQLKNEYYASNDTAEGLILELNYVNVEATLKSLIDNYQGYAQGVYEAINEYVGMLNEQSYEKAEE